MFDLLLLAGISNHRHSVLKSVSMKAIPSQQPLHLIDPDSKRELAAVEQFVPISAKYADSTNQLWWAISEHRRVGVLKLCHIDGVAESVFWQGMQGLFGLHYPSSMGLYAQVYSLLSQLCQVPVPKLIAAQSASEQYAGFLYAQALPGESLEDRADEKMVQQLALHLSALHRHQQSQFGSLFAPQFGASEWWARVEQTIADLAQQQGMAFDVRVPQTPPQNFVPIMPDLRWDQFLQQSSKLTGLVDLDAFVLGARELEFVVLEYLLDEQQTLWFKRYYELEIPKLDACRVIYRQLLFLMNILGVESIDDWMQAPSRF